MNKSSIPNKKHNTKQSKTSPAGEKWRIPNEMYGLPTEIQKGRRAERFKLDIRNTYRPIRNNNGNSGYPNHIPKPITSMSQPLRQFRNQRKVAETQNKRRKNKYSVKLIEMIIKNSRNY